MTLGYLDFNGYINVSESHKREWTEDWKAAIGLQTVDGMQDNRRRDTEGS